MQVSSGATAPVQFEQIEVGHAFPETTYRLLPEAVSDYVSAVGDTSTPRGEVPPMALSAWAMASLAKVLVIPPGTIHTAQEVSFVRQVGLGATICCQAKVVQKQARSRFRMLGVEMTISAGGQPALVQKTSLVLPEPDGEPPK